MAANIRFFYNKESKEIEIYYGEEKEENNIDLGILEAGTEVQKIISVYNKLAYPVNISFELNGEKIKLKDEFNEIPPSQRKNLTLIIDTKLTELKAPKANIKIKIHLVVV